MNKMFKCLMVVSITLISSLEIKAQNEIFHWAGSIGGSSYDLGSSITTDAAGNVYSTGAIQGVAIDLDPGPLGHFVNANGGYDTYIHKVNAGGYLEWAKTFGGTQNDVGLSIALDANGNIFVTGHFFGTTDFDPGAGVFELTSNGARDIYILKLDANGDFLWARSFGAGNDDYGHSIATDASGNVYTAGKFRGSIDFDPGVAEMIFTANGNDDIFIQKLDGDGDFLWATTMGDANNDRAFGITTDANGNVYTTGAFVGTVDFDPGVGTLDLSTGLTGFDIFIQKLDTDGNLIWAKVMGGTNWDYGLSIATDASGNVYTTGYFHLTVDFDPGAGTANLTANDDADIYVQKLDANGDFLWAKSMGGTGDDFGNSIATDGIGNVYTTGEFAGSVDFDPGAGTMNFSASGFSDIYYQKLDTHGNFLWATKFGATSTDKGQGITVDAGGNICGTGYFGSTVDFNPGVGTTNLTAIGGDSEIFIQKFSQPSTVGISENNQNELVKVYPNPTNGDIRIILDGFEAPKSLKIYDMTGKLVRTESLESNRTIDYQLPDPLGIYLVQVIGLDGVATSVKVIKS